MLVVLQGAMGTRQGRGTLKLPVAPEGATGPLSGQSPLQGPMAPFTWFLEEPLAPEGRNKPLKELRASYGPPLLPLTSRDALTIQVAGRGNF